MSVKFSALSPSEQKRAAACKGCMYLGIAGPYVCCDYIFVEGHRRPCKFGEGCTVKKAGRRRRAYTVKLKSLGLERVDRQTAGTTGRKPGSGIYERQLKWDVEKGKRLYEAGRPLREIAAEVGLNYDSFRKFAKRRGWTRPDGYFGEWDTETGRVLYESGVPVEEISKQLGVSVSALYAAARRRGWQHRGKRVRKDEGKEG